MLNILAKSFLRIFIFALMFFVQPGDLFAHVPKLHIFTVASKHFNNLDKLIESCEAQNLSIKVLALNQRYELNGSKLWYMDQNIQDLPDDDLVLFVDAYDVLILADEETIVNKFLSMNASVVISAETNCYPLPERRDEYPLCSTRYKYVNSGSYMGYVSSVKEMMQLLAPINIYDCDQAQLTRLYLAHKDKFALDYYCELFWPLHDVPASEMSIDVENRRVSCLSTGSTPCLIHGNGGGRDAYYYLSNLFFPD